MPSESARATTAEEARFRIDDPNARPRAIKVIALDAASERVVKQVARLSWSSATFFASVALDAAPAAGEAWSVTGWLNDLAGRAKSLVDEIASADLVVMVSTAGGAPPAASIIGEAASLRGVMTTALILDAGSTSDEALSRTLAALRPYASMLVVASGVDYIEAMLAALRA